MQLTRYNMIFLVLLVLDFFLLLFVADGFSISYKEALIYFNQTNILSFITYISTVIFGQNDMALRLPFILFYISSIILLYALTKNYFKNSQDRLFSIIIFMLLPGVNSAALLLNEAIIVMFFTLLYLYLRQKNTKEPYWLLFICLFIDNSFAIMYLALFFYSLRKKDNTLLIISLILFGASMQMYGFDSSGKPKGYFLDTFGMYASIFSPLVFFYFFYAMYRISIKENRDLYWYISFTALAFSLLFSLRQRIYIEDFAPFVVIAIPLMVKLFMHTYRVRLPQFRKQHNIIATLFLAVLIANSLVFFINKPLYLLLHKPKKHFAVDYHIAKELSEILKKKNLNYILFEDEKLQLRLKFYNIQAGQNYHLTSTYDESYDKISIKYYDKEIKLFYLQALK